jgi:hypothetical protein
MTEKLILKWIDEILTFADDMNSQIQNLGRNEKMRKSIGKG